MVNLPHNNIRPITNTKQLIMKSRVLIFGFLLCCMSLGAQQKVKELVTDQYDRNSVSYILVDRNDYYDSDVNHFYNNMTISSKFDVNTLSTRWMNSSKARPNVLAQDEVDYFVNKSRLGHEIISYIYNRKADGTFDDKILIERVEDDYYVQIEHDMTKTHYISFVAAMSSDKIQMIKLYPEGNAETRFQLRGRGYIYIYCNKHGLMKIKV